MALAPDVSAAADPERAREAPSPDVEPELSLGFLPLERLELLALVERRRVGPVVP